jgi:hypothetical protein
VIDLDGEAATAIALCIPPGSVVATSGRPSPALLDVLRARSCRVVEQDATDEPADVVVLATPLDLLDDVGSAVTGLASRLDADGRLVALVPASTHAAVRLDLTDPAPTPEQRDRTSDASWPAIASTLSGAGLHPWWFLPVRRDILTGTGIDPSSISSEVRAAVAGDPTAEVALVVVVAGRTAVPPLADEATAQLAHEVERAWAAFDEERRRAGGASDARLAEMRRQVDDLDARLHVALAERDAARLQVAASAEQISALDHRWQATQRGFARLGLSLDRRMLAHPRLRGIHAALGRVRRRA